MIGSVIMEVGEAEMIAAIQFYLNREVFYAGQGMRNGNVVSVVQVRQKSNGRFVIEFDGQPEPEFKVEEVRV